MRKDRIALQLYSVRQDAQKDLYGTLKQVKAMGYAGVEFAGLYGYDPEQIRKMCEELELNPISAHVPFAELLEDVDKVIRDYKTIGCKHIVIPYLLDEYRPGTEGFATVIEKAAEWGKKMAENGLYFQYHNHDFEFVKLDGEYALDILYKAVAPEYLQTQLDTCWVNVGGENPVDYLHKYAGRMPTVHLKDFAGSKSENMYALIGIDEQAKKEITGKFEFRALGLGLQKFPEIIEAATEGGAQWFIVEQDNPSMGYTSLECAAISAKYLLDLCTE